MTFRSMPTSLMVATVDVATILLGTLYLAGRRLQAGYQLRQLSDLQLRDIGLNRSEERRTRRFFTGKSCATSSEGGRKNLPDLPDLRRFRGTTLGVVH